MILQEKHHYFLQCILLAVLLIIQNSFSLAFDKIIAIVDKEIILHSDLEEMKELYQNQPVFQDMDDEKKLGFILEKLINEKIMLTIAQRDTTIELSEGELDHSSKNYLQQLYDQNGGRVCGVVGSRVWEFRVQGSKFRVQGLTFQPLNFWMVRFLTEII